MANITIILQNSKGEKIGEFPAHENKSIAQSAKENNINIPISCKLGICEICKAKVISGHELIQIDKISMPMKPLPIDQEGRFTSIFTCLAGVKTKYFKDDIPHILVLEKNI